MAKYHICLKKVSKEISRGSLPLEGANPLGERIDFTNYYMEKNGHPFFGISGEFHYSRYPFLEWEDEIIKLKMAGINTLATYVFWNHHEEDEGVFCWDDDRNLRYFIELCAKHNLDVFLRVGPFCHGECRNGGFPDWLYGRPFELRSNDENYLFYVKRLYSEIAKQVSGLFYQEGGPIVAVQLENEYMHAAAPWEITGRQGDEFLPGGRDGIEHMRMLKKIAIESGLFAPIYTSTGWGGAPVLEGEVLPLYGGYAFCPWNINENKPEQEPTIEYVFQSFHDNHAHCRGFNPPYPPEKYPYACCEMGGGMQTWYKARFVVPPESVTAMTVTKVAGGCNFVGYYMFHGGTHPVGKHGFLNENTNPKISYDYQAPLGEFGQIRQSYRYLKPFFYFFKEFQQLLCPMATVLPDDAAQITPKDTASLRWAIRTNGDSGFIFLNNYQDHSAMVDHENVFLNLELPDETLTLPVRSGLTLKSGVSAILPFNIDLDGVGLKYATAQFVTSIQAEEVHSYFFFVPEGLSGEYCFEKNSFKEIKVSQGELHNQSESTIITVKPGKECMIDLTAANGQQIRICTLSQQEIFNFWTVNLWGAERVIFTDASLIIKNNTLQLFQTAESQVDLMVYPGLGNHLETSCGRVPGNPVGLYTHYVISIPPKEPKYEIKQVNAQKAVLKIDPGSFQHIHELLLRIDYEGDVGHAFIDGRLVHDHFCNGQKWEIGLKRFYPEVADKGMYFYISPLHRGKMVSYDSAMAVQQEFLGDTIARIHRMEIVPEYCITISETKLSPV
jgi:hypothetical protein